jgi:midasin
MHVNSILLALLQKPGLSNGPLHGISLENIASLDSRRLHTLLIAYYRILMANRNLPEELSWSLYHLLAIFQEPHPDAGVRFLAIRCYGLQKRMLEVDRNKLERESVGDVVESDVPILYEVRTDGQETFVEACLFGFQEIQRVTERRNAIVHDADHYYTYEQDEIPETIDPSQLRYVVPPICICMTNAPKARVLRMCMVYCFSNRTERHPTLRRSYQLQRPPVSCKISL